MFAAEVTARIEDAIPELNHRIGGAVELSEVLKKNGAFPQAPVSAYVVPGGIQGGDDQSVIGAYQQQVLRLVTVVVAFRGLKKTAARSLTEVEPVLDALVSAIVGWTPDEETLGVFVLRGQVPVSFAGDAVVYQTDFAISDQLRIP